MSLTPSQLREPVTLEDALDQEEYIEAALDTQKALYDRVWTQYQDHTWISNELWAISELLNQAAQRMAALRQSNCFPRSEDI